MRPTLAPSQDFSIATLPSMEDEDGEPMASHLVYDDRIGQEIIEGDSELSKEIYVESGTTVDKIRDPFGGLEGRSLETLGDEMVCTTMTVLVAASVGVVLLQVMLSSDWLLNSILTSDWSAGLHPDHVSPLPLLLEVRQAGGLKRGQHQDLPALVQNLDTRVP